MVTTTNDSGILKFDNRVILPSIVQHQFILNVLVIFEVISWEQQRVPQRPALEIFKDTNNGWHRAVFFYCDNIELQSSPVSLTVYSILIYEVWEIPIISALLMLGLYPSLTVAVVNTGVLLLINP